MVVVTWYKGGGGSKEDAPGISGVYGGLNIIIVNARSSRL